VAVTKAEQAYQILRERIMDGTFGPGHRLVIDALGREYGISSVPWRESLRRLEAEGWVDIIPNVGAVVKTFDTDSWMRTMRLLARLSGLATSLSGPALTPEDLTEARQLNRDMGDALANFDPARFGRLNRRFHELICSRCDDEHLNTLVHAEWTRLELIRKSAFWMPSSSRPPPAGTRSTPSKPSPSTTPSSARKPTADAGGSGSLLGRPRRVRLPEARRSGASPAAAEHRLYGRHVGGRCGGSHRIRRDGEVGGRTRSVRRARHPRRSARPPAADDHAADERDRRPDRAAGGLVLTTESWRGEPTVMEPEKCAAIAWFALTDLPSAMPDYERLVLDGLAAGRIEPFTSFGFETSR
jgi:DNA-binding GntR family transcriptional regulator